MGDSRKKANDKQYLETMMKAAELGDPEAQSAVAFAKMKGIYGLDKDVKKAIVLYKASALKGNVSANMMLAKQYGAYGNELVEPYYKKTYENTLLAYKNDLPEAFMELAKIHARDYRIERSFLKALNIIEELNKKISAGLDGGTSQEYEDRAKFVSRWVFCQS